MPSCSARAVFLGGRGGDDDGCGLRMQNRGFTKKINAVAVGQADVHDEKVNLLVHDDVTSLRERTCRKKCVRLRKATEGVAHKELHGRHVFEQQDVGWLVAHFIFYISTALASRWRCYGFL